MVFIFYRIIVLFKYIALYKTAAMLLKTYYTNYQQDTFMNEINVQINFIK